jgi:hypothetical protein
MGRAGPLAALWLALTGVASCNQIAGINEGVVGCALDGVVNGLETDVDCGGGCLPCLEGKKCNAPEDCASGACFNKKCVAAQCTDGLKNGDETDVDCGGPLCVASGYPCLDGQGCGTDGANCLSQICTNGICQPATCDDGVKNGTETWIDCGGGTCQPCPATAPCTVGADCVSGRCVAALGICGCSDDGDCLSGACNKEQPNVCFCNGADQCLTMNCAMMEAVGFCK